MKLERFIYSRVENGLLKVQRIGNLDPYSSSEADGITQGILAYAVVIDCLPAEHPFWELEIDDDTIRAVEDREAEQADAG